MKSLTILAGLATLASTSPLGLAVRNNGVTDGDILNYALTLEHLEDKFYREGLARFNLEHFKAAGFTETFYKNIKETSLDETTHVKFLTGALKKAGVKPVAECKYDFKVTDVKSFIATASVLEGVGVSAYLGAAAKIMSKDYLTAAGSILTVEARHSSYIRAGLKQLPFPQPFDAPLTLDEVYSLAAPFFVSCPPSNPPLPVKAFPTVAASGKTPFYSGSKVTLTPAKPIHPKGPVYAAFVTVTGPIFVEVKHVGSGYQVTIPKGVNGQSYIILTSCKDKVSDDTTYAVGIVEISNSKFIAA